MEISVPPSRIPTRSHVTKFFRGRFMPIQTDVRGGGAFLARAVTTRSAPRVGSADVSRPFSSAPHGAAPPSFQWVHGCDCDVRGDGRRGGSSKDVSTALLPSLSLTPPDAALQVDTVVPNATVSEREAFQLDCSVVSRSSQESRFAVAWFSLRTKAGGKRGSPGLEEQEQEDEDEGEEGEEEEDPTERTVLLSVGPDAVFGPEGRPWEGRLRFQRLSPLLYRLSVLQASPRDTGNYSCRVEEWLPSPQKGWYRLVEEESAPVSVHVLDTSEFSQLTGEGGHGRRRPCLEDESPSLVMDS